MTYSYPHFASPFLQGLYNWQTLVGALLALAAALLGSILLWKQIQQARQEEAERRRRRFVAARATMPLLLSGICTYAREVAATLRTIHPAAGQHGFGTETFLDSVPALPAELPASLERLIEATGNDALAESLADLLGELQVLRARISELPNLGVQVGGLQLMIEDYMLQTAGVYAGASSLFDYARREVEELSHGEVMTVRSALNILELRDHEFERLHQTMARRAQSALARTEPDAGGNNS